MTLTRRERRIETRRQVILEGAARVFAEKGFHRATTKEIAEAADIAEGTIYNYFKSKDDLLLALFEQIAALNARTVEMSAALDRDPREFFVQHFAQRMHTVEPAYPLIMAVLPEMLASAELRSLYGEHILKPAVAMLENHLQARVERGQLRSVDVPFLTRALVGMIMGLQLLLILQDPVTSAAWDSPEELVDRLADIVLDGVLPQPANGDGDAG